MPLSIKNPRAEKLAREVAEACHESITQAIIRALEERLQRIRGRKDTDSTIEDILTISRRCTELPDLDEREPDDILGYDEHGTLP